MTDASLVHAGPERQPQESGSEVAGAHERVAGSAVPPSTSVRVAMLAHPVDPLCRKWRATTATAASKPVAATTRSARAIMPRSRVVWNTRPWSATRTKLIVVDELKPEWRLCVGPLTTTRSNPSQSRVRRC
jgi:hypothetical protein